MARDLKDLEWRREFAQMVIKVIDEMPDDPRKPEAMIHYKGQLAQIDAEITEITGTPPPIVVGLKTATLFGKSKLGEGG